MPDNQFSNRFHAALQREVTRLGLINAKIKTDRHNGENQPVKLKFFGDNCFETGSNNLLLPQHSFTPAQIRRDLDELFSVLLGGCVLVYGEVGFEVRRGQVKLHWYNEDFRPGEDFGRHHRRP